MVTKYCPINTFRLAAALIANKHKLERIIIAKNLSKHTYVFEASEELFKDLNNIESGKDHISTLGIYTALDYLSSKLSEEIYRTRLDAELSDLISKKNG